jgi:transcriptional regulator with XRE-family HTH domain
MDKPAFSDLAKLPSAKAEIPVLTLLGLPLPQRIRLLREQRGLPLEVIAHETALTLTFLEDIEAGLEPVLANTVRLKLARILRVSPQWLKPQPLMENPNAKTSELARLGQNADNSLPGEALLYSPAEPLPGDLLGLTQVFQIYQQRLPLQAMAQNPKGFWPCPQCGAKLLIHPFPRQDMEGHPLMLLRANCSQCLFRFEEEFAL